MKNLKYLFLAICSIAFFSACSDDDEVHIDSLQVFGEEFYYGETVNVGMSVSMSNPDDADFYWECDGGTFLQRQGYKLNQWKAPSKVGYYTIKCTVKCGSAKQTREAVIFVSGFFFENFNGKDGTNAAPTSGWAQSNTTMQIRNGRQELFVSTQGQASGEFRYNLGKSDLYPPFSFKSDIGIVGTSANNYNPVDKTPWYPNDSILFAFAGKDNNCAYALSTNTPSASIAPTYFISELRLEWWPMNHVLSRVQYIPVGETEAKTFMATDFDAVLRFQWTRRANASEGIPQATGWYGIPFKTSALKYSWTDDYILSNDDSKRKTVGIAVDEDYTVRVLVNGTEIFKTDEIKNWRPGYGNAPIAVKEYKYIYPAKTRLFVDNVYFYLDSNFGN